MKTIIVKDSQESIVRHYLDALMAYDEKGMLAQIHPAVHYERYLSNKQAKLINGIENFRQHAYEMTHGYRHSFELHTLKHDRDRVEITFGMMVQPSETEPEEYHTGSALFWFMDDKIFQIVAAMD